MKKTCTLFLLITLLSFSIFSQSISELDYFASIIDTKPVQIEEIPNENPRVDAGIFQLWYPEYSEPIYCLTLFSSVGKTEYYLSDLNQQKTMIVKKTYFYKQPYTAEGAEIQKYVLLLNSKGLFLKNEEGNLQTIQNISDLPATIDFRSCSFMFHFLHENLDIFNEGE